MIVGGQVLAHLVELHPLSRITTSFHLLSQHRHPVTPADAAVNVELRRQISWLSIARPSNGDFILSLRASSARYSRQRTGEITER